MRLAGLFLSVFALLTFVGCGDQDPVSSVSEKGLTAPAGKLTASATKAGGYRGERGQLLIYQEMLDAANAQDLDQWMSHWTEDPVWDNVTLPPVLNGKEDLAAFMTDFLRGFPDFRASPKRTFCAGTTLVVESIYSGTLQDEWLGVPGMGQRVQAVPVLEIWEFDGDKIEQGRLYWNAVALMIQLGVMPPSEGSLPLVPSFELPDSVPTGLSPLQANAENVARFNAGSFSGFAEMIHPDAAIDYLPIGATLGRGELVAMAEIFHLGFPDISMEIVRQVDMGDGWVLSEQIARGTNDGPYVGIPPTGKSATLRVVYLRQFDADGLLIDQSLYYDTLSLLVQLGLAPAP